MSNLGSHEFQWSYPYIIWRRVFILAWNGGQKLQNQLQILNQPMEKIAIIM